MRSPWVIANIPSSSENLHSQKALPFLTLLKCPVRDHCIFDWIKALVERKPLGNRTQLLKTIQVLTAGGNSQYIDSFIQKTYISFQPCTRHHLRELMNKHHKMKIKLTKLKTVDRLYAISCTKTDEQGESGR